MKVFSLHDLKAKRFSPPMVYRNAVDAERDIQQSALREGTPLHSHPDDFVLEHIGEWDEDTGNITPIQPTVVAKVTDLLQ